MVLTILFYLLEVLKWLIVARALASWFIAPHSRNAAVDFLRRITDPILAPISRIVPVTGGLDLSPLIAFFALTVLQRLVI
jgi:YggT family protein